MTAATSRLQPSSFNFPGRKNHPEPDLAAAMGQREWMFQLPRTEEPSGTCPGQHELAEARGVSTSPDGRTIRNTIEIPITDAMVGRFQLPRTEEPSGTSGPSPMAGGWFPGFNFPGRKNHPEPARPSTQGRPDGLVSTSPDGRTIRNAALKKLRAACSLRSFSAQHHYGP